jgi:hypothetical protein
LPPIKFNFGRFSQLATLELIAGVARLDGFWPFPWLPLPRLLSAGVLMRRCELVVVFIGLELDTFSSRIYNSFSPGFVQRKTRIRWPSLRSTVPTPLCGVFWKERAHRFE